MKKILMFGAFLFVLLPSLQTIHAESFTITINSAKAEQLSNGTYHGTVNYCFSSIDIPKGNMKLTFLNNKGAIAYNDTNVTTYPSPIICNSSNSKIGNTYEWNMSTNLDSVSLSQSNYLVKLKYFDENGTQLYTATVPSSVTNISSTGLNRTLSLGMRGIDVTALQNYLINAGILKTSATGYFGNATFVAVKEFQRQNNMPIAGSAGPITRGLINSIMQGSHIDQTNITVSPMTSQTSTTDLQAKINSLMATLNSLQAQLSTTKNVTTNTSTQQTSNTDISSARLVLDEIRQGYIVGNESLITKHLSVETAKFFASANSGIKPVSTFIIGNIFQVGSNIVADVTSTESTLTGPMVFIKESGDWKLDLTATMQYITDQNNAKKNVGDPNGSVDLVITGVSVSPVHPLVNSKDVQISISVKNIGTKTANEVSLESKILEFTADWAPHQIEDLIPLTPGETVVETYNPYKSNDFFKISDTAGLKTIQIVLNKDRKIVESNYDNNIFTQTVQMYGN